MTFQDVEKARQVYAAKIKNQIIVTVIIVALLLIPIIITSRNTMTTIFGIVLLGNFAIVISVIIARVFNHKARQAYHDAYKAYFVEQSLKTTFTDLNYSHEAILPATILESTGVITTGDRYSSNDYISGKYRDIAFSQADVHIEEAETDSEGHVEYDTLFRGRFMIFEFPKQFEFKLAIIGNNFSAYTRPTSRGNNARKMEKISTESGEFNSQFRTLAEDGFEAYYILDPAFMVKLMDIDKNHNGKDIFCFMDNQLIIGINDGKDSLEPPQPLKPIEESNEKAKITNDIKMITDLVEQLSLKHKIFK